MLLHAALLLAVAAQAAGAGHGGRTLRRGVGGAAQPQEALVSAPEDAEEGAAMLLPATLAGPGAAAAAVAGADRAPALRGVVAAVSSAADPAPWEVGAGGGRAEKEEAVKQGAREQRHSEREAEQREAEQRRRTTEEEHGEPFAKVWKERGLISDQQWFQWWYWRPIVYCGVTLLFFSEVVGPILDCLVEKSLLGECTLFFVQMMAFMLVAVVSVTPHAAGAEHILALSTIMMALSFLAFLYAVGLKLKTVAAPVAAGVSGGQESAQASTSRIDEKGNDPVNKIMNDISYLFRPFSRCVLVFLVVMGILEEVSADWGGLVTIAAFLALGLAFAVSGIALDLMSHVFIRIDDHFRERDFLIYDGDMIRVTKVTWRYVIAIHWKTRAEMYIPNNHFISKVVRNQSKDIGRVLNASFPISGSTPADAVQAIVKKCWAVLRSTSEEGFTFEALNGERLENGIDAKKTKLFLKKVETVDSTTEFAAAELHLKLVGLHHFSRPPPWKGDPGAKPRDEERQLEWEAHWNFQVEWFLLEVKKIVEQHSK